MDSNTQPKRLTRLEALRRAMADPTPRLKALMEAAEYAKAIDANEVNPEPEQSSASQSRPETP
jgi:hypothetical protein